jgi:uncharacterized MAPEG superfamily protein
MSIKLILLGASVIHGIVHVIVISHFAELATRLSVDASSREQNVTPLAGIAGKAGRALRNYLETLPFFAAAVLGATVAKTPNSFTLWGAHFYFWGRIVYAILYAADFPLARSCVTSRRSASR